VAGVVAQRTRPYNRCASSRLWRGSAAAAALILALAAGGCSISYQLDSYFGGGKPTTTGSITPPPGAKAVTSLPPAGDLAYARAAVSEVLRHGKKDSSQPWENPRSGARGTVTPIASAYLQDGHTCRNFLASYVNGDAEAWLQGEACKQGKDSWEVRSLKPWERS
jgi:17 kDa outer membrane surface antigen